MDWQNAAVSGAVCAGVLVTVYGIWKVAKQCYVWMYWKRINNLVATEDSVLVGASPMGRTYYISSPI